MTIDSAITRDAAFGLARRPAAARGAFVESAALADVPATAWADLAGRALEPNAFFLPGWARAVDAHATGKTGARALVVWDGPARSHLIGILPVVSAWRAYRMPLPVLVGWQAYAPLTTPLLDRDAADSAARGLLDAAALAGAHALMLPALAAEGPAAQALHRAGVEAGAAPVVIASHRRAMLDARQDDEAMLREALGAKKLKELRRQRNRLSDEGDVTFRVAVSEPDAAKALACFLALEDAGWKGSRGTALARDAGDRSFIEQAIPQLVREGHASVVTLDRGDDTLAAGVVLRHLGRAFFFKIAHDELLAKLSPGVQLTLELTQHLCADPAITHADSIAVAGHPMIDHIWRDRLSVADTLITTRPGGAGFSLFTALIAGRHATRETARRAVQAVRHHRRSRL